MKKEKRRINIWKVISIISIILFVLIVVGGLIRVYHHRPSSIKPTAEQVNLAKGVVYDDLKGKVQNITIDDLKTQGRAMSMKDKGAVIEVFLNKGNTRYSYLVDLTSGEILVRSETSFFGRLKDFKPDGDGSDLNPERRFQR